MHDQEKLKMIKFGIEGVLQCSTQRNQDLKKGKKKGRKKKLIIKDICLQNTCEFRTCESLKLCLLHEIFWPF